MADERRINRALEPFPCSGLGFDFFQFRLLRQLRPFPLRSRLGRSFQQFDQQGIAALFGVFLLLGLFGFHETTI